MTTRRAWLREATDRLRAAGNEDAAFDARCLLEDLGGLGRGRMPDDLPLTPEQDAALARALAERIDGRPLQYILGEWEFLTLRLRVGEGVLIPRPDTEVLCETAAARLSDRPAPRVLDLCAGSGCVGLGIASLCPAARVTALELADEAFPYLTENIARYPALDVTARRADVLTAWADELDRYDAIVANPPYIPTGDLAGLSREVHREPTVALDGDRDGLRFYRVIAARWSERLTPGGFCAVEVGIGQAAAVAALFTDVGLTAEPPIRDSGGVDRVVIAHAAKKL